METSVDCNDSLELQVHIIILIVYKSPACHLLIRSFRPRKCLGILPLVGIVSFISPSIPDADKLMVDSAHSRI
jgi:hypothetical protein